MTSLPANAKLCHRCAEHYIGRACPKCPPLVVGSPIGVCQDSESGTDDVNAAPPARPKAKRSMEAPALNRTEQRWQDAHPSHVPFPMKLRWGKCMQYTPDFLFRDAPVLSKPILIEVKGGHIFDRDIVRFKGCAAEWGWIFDFQMHQWKDRKWTRLL